MIFIWGTDKDLLRYEKLNFLSELHDSQEFYNDRTEGGGIRSSGDASKWETSVLAII